MRDVDLVNRVQVTKEMELSELGVIEGRWRAMSCCISGRKGSEVRGQLIGVAPVRLSFLCKTSVCLCVCLRSRYL